MGALRRTTADAQPRDAITLRHVSALDAVRGLAILLVVAMHADIVRGGALGVDLFFVLSGFLITSLLVRDWRSAERISLHSFYRRRAVRLIPALALMIVVVTGATVLLHPANSRTTVLEAAACLVYIANVVQAAHGTFHVPSLMPLWSLATEEQFYLIWPPVLFLMVARKVRPRTIALGLLTLALASMLWRVVLLSEHVRLQRLWFATDTHADPILIGCMAGIAYSFALVRRVQAAWAWLAFLTAALIVAIVPFLSPIALIAMPFFAGACAIVILACVLESDSLLVRAIDRRLLRFFGRISYALYLWQLPIFYMIGWRTGLPVAIAVASASTYLVERPLARRLSRSNDTSNAPQTEHRPPARQVSVELSSAPVV
jgi:peptidoglycan/LPS O-acetylase OafA/YrhL